MGYRYMPMPQRVQDALQAAGARLKRDRKHLVYELANGTTLVMARTPSDRRAEDNVLRDIKRLLQQEVRR